MTKVKKEIKIAESEKLSALLGNFDENLNAVVLATGVEAYANGSELVITGEKEAVELASLVVEKLLGLIAAGEIVDKTRIQYCVELAKDGQADDIEKITSGVIAVTAKGKPIKCKTVGQSLYVEEIKKNEIVFGVGPAGTGKTYLAVAMAVSALKSKRVEKIILTRPAVEAGERLGYLPGDLQSKIDPYLRPLYDALQEMLGLESYSKLLERGVIEVAPLAYMRGRTLNDAYIILDEAQNATKEQMKMFLTRMGEGSRMIINGDVTQIDLPSNKKSGLKHAIGILKNIEGIGIVRLTHKDVVRHPLVMRIIKAYAKEE